MGEFGKQHLLRIVQEVNGRVGAEQQKTSNICLPAVAPVIPGRPAGMLGSSRKTWLDVEGGKQRWSCFTVETGGLSVSPILVLAWVCASVCQNCICASSV